MMLSLIWRLWSGSPLPATTGGHRGEPIVQTSLRVAASGATRAADLSTALRGTGDQAALRADAIQASARPAALSADRACHATGCRRPNLSTARRTNAS